MKIVIVGKGSGWQKAPYGVEGGKMWGVNDICLRRRVDLVFNMHDLDKHKNHPLFNKTVAHVNQHKLPIITQKDYAHIPTCIPFPLWFFDRKYFTNSIDYMVAYACYHAELVDQIDMYGVVMAVGSEYAVQRPSLEYWIGMFEGGGGRVNIFDPTFVCQCLKGRYGYDWDEEDMLHVLEREENKNERCS